MMRRLPASPSRSQALIELEPILHKTFQAHTTKVSAEVRDAMHYALFRTTDRFCVSSAWLVAPRLGVSAERFALMACAIEILRCSLELKLSPNDDKKFLEQSIAEAATYGLIPLAFEMLLNGESPLTDHERTELGALLARAASPVHVLSALHRESRVVSEGASRLISISELQSIQQEKVSSAFSAAGESLVLLSSARDKTAGLGNWFRRLGLFAHWVGEFASHSDSGLALLRIMTMPEAMDLIKSLEVELLTGAQSLGIRDAAHDIIEPLAETLKTRLQ